MSIKAYATVRLTGCNIRRFINLCTANHIKIWNLKYVSPRNMRPAAVQKIFF